MNRISLFLILASFGVLLNGCGKDTNKKFTLRLDTNFDVPAGLNVLDAHYFIIRGLLTNYSSIINKNTIPAGAQIRLEPERASLEDLFNQTDLDFIDKISVRIFTNDNPTDKPECFYLENIPLNVDNYMDLFPTSFDANPFLESPEINVEVKITLKRNSGSQSNLHLTLDFKGNY